VVGFDMLWSSCCRTCLCCFRSQFLKNQEQCGQVKSYKDHQRSWQIDLFYFFFWVTIDRSYTHDIPMWTSAFLAICLLTARPNAWTENRFPKSWGSPNSWLVYNRKSYWNGWLRGTPIYMYTSMYIYIIHIYICSYCIVFSRWLSILDIQR
jgi:hypothetical protein